MHSLLDQIKTSNNETNFHKMRDRIQLETTELSKIVREQIKLEIEHKNGVDFEIRIQELEKAIKLMKSQDKSNICQSRLSHDNSNRGERLIDISINRPE